MTSASYRGLVCVFACVLLSSVSGISARQTVKPPTSSKHDSGLHIHWDDVMAEDKSTPNEVYCLMGSGWIMAPTSSNIKKLISVWIAKNPQSRVVRVSTYGPIMVDQPNSLQSYVWVVEGQTSLNEYLVRRGACPGGTMQIPDYSNISSRTGKVEKYPFHFKTLVSPQEYSHFLKRIEQAEAQAQKEKLGIWKNGTDDVY